MPQDSPTAFPFAAVPGMEMARQALLLLAVDPGLKGALIAAGPGRAKGLLVRGFRALMRDFGAAFVDLPPGVTEDNLLGGLHLERTLATGVRRTARGILARAHGGFLYLDQANLIDRTLVCHLANALSSGRLRLERDGISAEFHSAFTLIATYDPAEGCLHVPLAEAAALHVHEEGPLPGEQRVEMLERVAAYDRAPEVFCRRFAAASNALRDRIAAARERLPHVQLGAEELRRLVGAAMLAASTSHRAELFAVRCARANAAWMGRKAVEEEDLAVAVRLVLSPRAAPAAPLGAAPQPVEGSDGESSAGERGEEMKIAAVDCRIADDLPEVHDGGIAGAAEQPSRRRSSSAAAASWERGRYVRAVAVRPGARRIDVAATLAAAAPFQTRRVPRPAVRIEKQDLRFKEFRQKAGVLTIFVVDSSGSMAASRMDQAKGALIRLLGEAYVYRDTVALIGFRGERAEVLLSPTRSVELAKRALDSLAVGGGTPLAAGLKAALEIAARKTEGSRILMVLLTDGRANVGAPEELERACAALRTSKVTSVVIDSRPRFTPGGETARLAVLLGGRRVCLERSASDSVYLAVCEAAKGLRSHGA